LAGRLEQGDWSAHGEDLSPYNRAALWVCDSLLAFPEQIKDLIAEYEQIQTVEEPQQGTQESWPVLEDEEDGEEG
jgi:hypothetical protein